MVSKAETTLAAMVAALVLGGILYVIYLCHTGKCQGSTSSSRGILPNRTRRAQEDAALQEMVELKEMFTQMTTVLEQKKKQKKKKGGGVKSEMISAGSPSNETTEESNKGAVEPRDMA